MEYVFLINVFSFEKYFDCDFGRKIENILLSRGICLICGIKVFLDDRVE